MVRSPHFLSVGPVALLLLASCLALAGCGELDDLLGGETETAPGSQAPPPGEQTSGVPTTGGPGGGVTDGPGTGPAPECTRDTDCAGALVCREERCVEAGDSRTPEQREDERRCRLDCELAQECDGERFSSTYTSVGACTQQCTRDIDQARRDAERGCFNAQYARLGCVAELDGCAALDAYLEGRAGATCVDERIAAAAACDPFAAFCAEDCAQYATCTPDAFSNDHPSEFSCMESCIDNLVAFGMETTPQCFDSSFELYVCTAALDCSGYDAFTARQGEYPCRAEDERSADACFEWELCVQECGQLAACDPETFASYPSAAACEDDCAADLEALREGVGPACYFAEMALFACVTALSCGDLDRYFNDEGPDFPCRDEVVEAEASCG